LKEKKSEVNFSSLLLGPIGMSINLLTSDETNVIATAMTDTDGKYDFFGVTPGDYIVQVEKGNFLNFPVGF
jgi:hypothetical protein